MLKNCKHQNFVRVHDEESRYAHGAENAICIRVRLYNLYTKTCEGFNQRVPCLRLHPTFSAGLFPRSLIPGIATSRFQRNNCDSGFLSAASAVCKRRVISRIKAFRTRSRPRHGCDMRQVDSRDRNSCEWPEYERI